MVCDDDVVMMLVTFVDIVVMMVRWSPCLMMRRSCVYDEGIMVVSHDGVVMMMTFVAKGVVMMLL